MGVFKTNNQFKKEVKEKFGDKYNLDLCTYKSSHDFVVIKCNKCGTIFNIRATNLLMGEGCPECSKKIIAEKRRIGKNVLIQRIENKNHYGYDYRDFIYKNIHDDKCEVICHKKDSEGKEHGKFLINPWHLLNGVGCPKCAEEKKHLELVKNFNSKNKSIYKLKNSSYKEMRKNAIFYCPIHGEFIEKPSNILKKGYKCKKCLEEEKKYKKIRKKEETKYKEKIFLLKRENDFIEKSKEIYGNKFLYYKVSYKNAQKKVKLVCNNCGFTFEITPNNHIGKKKTRCPYCEGTVKDLKTFIRRANIKHKNKYDYTKSVYKSSHENTIVTCPLHGDFKIYPYHHLQGEGCPICKESKLEKEMKEFLDKNNIKYIYQYRVQWLGLQSLDFYLPDYKIGIECQGIQHFYCKEFYFGEKNPKEAFLKNIERDKIKNKKCLTNSIKLFYFYKKNKSISINDNILKGIYTKENSFTDKNKLLKEIKDA